MQEKNQGPDEVRTSSIFDLREKEPKLKVIEHAPLDAEDVSAPFFEDVGASLGIKHAYQTGPNELLLMVQPTGGGCGWLDYDRDGKWDLYLNQGGDPSQPSSSDQPTDQLFRNDEGHQFQNVTNDANIVEREYSQGVAIGDFDNDGFDDIFVTNAGPDRLFQNQGDGTFRDVTSIALQQPPHWSSSAAWGDLDRDGDLDLYVCRYLDFDRFNPQRCFTSEGRQKMCQPHDVDAIPDAYYLNEGSGHFREASRESGLFGDRNKALGVALADLNNDGWLDVYVANDATPNFLFLNQQDGSFRNDAAILGCAVAWEGRSQASMGIAVGDHDRNGLLDLYLTHYEGEWNTLYLNHGESGFSDVTAQRGGVTPTLPVVGFGTVMEDFDQNGELDLIVANGHLDDPGHLRLDLEMNPQLFTFLEGQMVDVSRRCGSFFERKLVGRGLATADWDSDGDLDLAIVNHNSESSVLRNDSICGSWLNLEFVGTESNRRGIGTRVVATFNGEAQLAEISGGTTYCSTNQPVVSFGFGTASGACDLTVIWPNGHIQLLENVSLNQRIVLSEPRFD